MIFLEEEGRCFFDAARLFDGRSFLLRRRRMAARMLRDVARNQLVDLTIRG